MLPGTLSATAQHSPMNFSFPLRNRQYFFAIVLSLAAVNARAQFTLTGTSYTQNFNGLTSTGTSTSTLDLGSTWYAGTGTGALTPANNQTVVAGTGSSNISGNYNFGIAGTNPVTDRALGSLAATSTQRDTEARFTNGLSLPIGSLTISYTGEQWRNGGATGVDNALVLEYSTNGSTWTNLGSAFDFHTPIDSGTAGALDGNLAANRVTSIGGVYVPSSQIAPSSTFYLRWADADDGGSDHGIAIDDFSLSISLVPEPGTWLAGMLALGAIVCSRRRRIAAMLAARREAGR